MENLKKYIDSGIIEMYVLGLATEEEGREVQALAAKHTEIREEIDAISNALMLYNKANTKLSPKVKPLLMAIIDYTERLKGGEAPAEVPLLSESSKVSDYASWLQRNDMIRESEDDAYARIIGYTPQAMTAIAWLNNEMPYEVHDREYEKFLIVEGSCDVILSDKVISLFPGDYYCIPLNAGHTIRITSPIPCKVILQRSAA